MILTEKRYRMERGDREETYQSFDVIVDMEDVRGYLQIELDHLSRWRSKEEYADYLRWAADEIEKLDIGE